MTYAQEGYTNKLKNKLFFFFFQFEKNRECEKFLGSIIIELMGVPEEDRTINYYILMYKLSTLRYLRYEYFRSTIFDCMTLISKG